VVSASCDSLPFDAGKSPSQAAQGEATEELLPCANPQLSLDAALKTLATANAADRLNLDWQAQNTVSLDYVR
jgi:hypothetical protein